MKKIVVIWVCALMVFSLLGCAQSVPDEKTDGSAAVSNATEGSEKESFKMGFAFYNLSNPMWAENVEEAVKYGALHGIDVTYVDAGEDSAKQISQIENFIQSGMDAIVICAIDVAAVEEVAKEAMDAGIYVIDFCRGIKNCHTSFNLDAVNTGKALAQMAAEWVKENYTDSEVVEWGFLNLPMIEIGVIEGDACQAEFERLVPNAELVGTGSTMTVESAMTATESILQANPDVRLFICLGAGGGVGGNEVLKTHIAEDEYDNYAVFSIDATEQEIINIINGDTQKGSISVGSGAEHGRILVDLALKLLNEEDVEEFYGMPITPITAENAQSYHDETFKK